MALASLPPGAAHDSWSGGTEPGWQTAHDWNQSIQQEPRWQQTEVHILTALESLAPKTIHASLGWPEGEKTCQMDGKPAFCLLDPCRCLLCRECLAKTLEGSPVVFAGQNNTTCVRCKAFVLSLRPTSFAGMQPTGAPMPAPPRRAVEGPVKTATTRSSVLFPSLQPKRTSRPRRDEAPTASIRPGNDAQVTSAPFESGFPPSFVPNQLRSGARGRTVPSNRSTGSARSDYEALYHLGKELDVLFAPEAESVQPSWPILKIHNIGFEWTVGDLEEFVRQKGGRVLPHISDRAVSVHIILDALTGKTRPFAFVEISSVEARDALVKQHDCCRYKGRELPLKSASPGQLLANLFPYSGHLFVNGSSRTRSDEHLIEFRSLLEAARNPGPPSAFRLPERPYRNFASLLAVYPWSVDRDCEHAEQIWTASCDLLTALRDRMATLLSFELDGIRTASVLLAAVSGCSGFSAQQKQRFGDLHHHLFPPQSSMDTATMPFGPAIGQRSVPTPIEMVQMIVSPSFSQQSGRGLHNLDQAVSSARTRPQAASIDASSAVATRFPLPPRPHDTIGVQPERYEQTVEASYIPRSGGGPYAPFVPANRYHPGPAHGPC